MWLAPNLVTLLGFFFILGNIILLEVYIPDLVGPVSSARTTFGGRRLTSDCTRLRHGYITASHLACGCGFDWLPSSRAR
jgi:hypothetical protein